MKSIVVDTGSVISMVTNNLLWVFRELSKKYKGDFLIPKSVEEELINYPLTTKKFKLEALMIKDLVLEGQIKVHGSPELTKLSKELIGLANNIFSTKHNQVKVIQQAETDVLALAILMKSDALLVDERTLRLLIENPRKLEKILEHRLHTKVTVNKNNLKKFSSLIKGVKVIRSTELITVAFELGLLNMYISTGNKVHTEFRKELLDGALWALKLKGCAISVDEINEILKFEGI